MPFVIVALSVLVAVISAKHAILAIATSSMANRLLVGVMLLDVVCVEMLLQNNYHIHQIILVNVLLYCMRRFEEPMLYRFRCSFSAEPFPFAFIDYDDSSQYNEGSLQQFYGKPHLANGTSSSIDWVIRHPCYHKKYH